MSWTQPVCTRCWYLEHPGRQPCALIDAATERCCLCNTETTSGIYIRINPATVAYPAAECG